jgi:hypothetical protein
MRAVAAVAAHELRTRWRAWVGLALLVAFAGGCVLTAAAGARRTDSAYHRFLVASRASDVLVSPAGSGLGGYYGALARLPGVVALAPIVGLSVLPVGPGGRPVLASVAAAFTFGANLLHLVHTPRLYGQTWDAAVDWQFGSFTPRQAQRVLTVTPGITGWSYGTHGTVGIGGLVIPAIGVAAGRGPVLSATMLVGRPPRTDREIVLGTSTIRRIGRSVGQMVTVTVGGRRQVDRIVGGAVFPNFGQGGFTPTDLGEGAETTTAGLGAVPPGRRPGGQPAYEFALLRFAPGPQRAAHIAAFKRSMSRICSAVQQPGCVVTDQRPNGVADYARIEGTPTALAVVLAVLGLAVLGQFIVVSGRRRRP